MRHYESYDQGYKASNLRMREDYKDYVIPKKLEEERKRIKSEIEKRTEGAVVLLSKQVLFSIIDDILKE